MTVKFNEFHIRLCHSEACNEIATHAVMWTSGPLYYCQACAEHLVHVGNVMSFTTPAATLRAINPMESSRALLATVFSGYICLMLNCLFDDSFGAHPAELSGEEIGFSFESVEYEITLHLSVPDGVALSESGDLDSRIFDMLKPYISRALSRIAANMYQRNGAIS